MRRQFCRVPVYQRGQSLVEVCVACIALVPLAIGLIYIGQYIHIKHTVQQAAREAAWDAAVARSTYEKHEPDSGQEQTRLRVRYYGAPATAIDVDPKAPKSFVDPLLLDYSGRQLLKPGKFTLAVYKNDKAPGLEGSIDSVFGSVTKWISKIPGMSGGEFPPDPNGYLMARVDAKTAKAKYFKPLDKLNLDFHSQTVLLADAWNADGGGEADLKDLSKVSANGAPITGRTVRNALPPSAALLGGGFGHGIAKVFNFFGKIPIVNTFFPTGGLNIGRAAPDVIPYDKLQPYQK
ncbi:MAG TPA: TadE/TadG family type IV pilus assembly protein [Rhodanobacteraceae bacterium]